VQLRPEGFDTFELLHCAAVMAFGLGVVSHEEGPTVGVASHAVETFRHQIIAVLGAGQGAFLIADEGLVEQLQGPVIGTEGLVEAGGEEAGLEARGAEDGLLGDGHALQGEEFLRVDGLVDGDEVVHEMGDFLEVFEADDGEAGGGEAVFAGVLGGAGLALWSTGSGGMGGVGAVGSALLFGDGHGSYS
jgi:hypothetical protein